jgi:hypothetical protein
MIFLTAWNILMKRKALVANEEKILMSICRFWWQFWAFDVK